VNTTPRTKRKRLRSSTPSDDELRSPLAKRRKLAADRNSRLKEGITAEELEWNGEKKRRGLVDDSVQAEDEEVEEDEFEDDFLARDLQEEWG